MIWFTCCVFLSQVPVHRTTLVGVSVVEFPKAFESQLLQRCRAPQQHAAVAPWPIERLQARKNKNTVFVAFFASRSLAEAGGGWWKEENIFIEKQAFEKQAFVRVFREQPAARAGF